MGKPIEARASFNIIRYANCWEDADVLVRALDVGPGASILSIGSAGDNSLSLLTLDPKRIVAVDLNPVQIACVEIRVAAFAELDHPSMLTFLGFDGEGIGVSIQRLKWFAAMRERLSERSRAYWDGNRDIIANGVIHAGKFERYFRIFRTRVLPLVHGRSKVSGLLEEKTLEERHIFYKKKWDSLRWRLMFRLFFSRVVMGRAGRDPEFFRYVEGNVAERVMRRATYALTQLPTHDNPYLRCILTGSFGTALPHYARPEHFDTIRSRLDRLETLCGTAQEAISPSEGRFDAFNLSDIFEYIDEPVFRECADGLLAGASAGARLAYWNMLVPRRVSTLLPDRVRRLDEISDRLHGNDRAFFYQAFHVDEVK
ncbi:MAG: DUF3419 family protein [Chitinispirillaceae bacterium]|nr:DUF3419 family protein [Chitinispirillaceae bacterium]